MARFFVKDTDILPDSVNITGEDVNHIKKVLRLKPGEHIVVSNGKGLNYMVRIESFEKDCVTTKIVHPIENITEPPIEVTLYQGLPKSDKMDYIIQKGVELGVNRIVPVITERAVVKISTQKDAEKKCERWNKISMEACKQCNRGVIPKVEMPMNFLEALGHMKNSDLILLPYEKESGNNIKSVLCKNKDVKSISVIIGPEGGFCEDEVKKALDEGANSVTLGPRILRTETAGVTVLSIIMYELGDLSI